MPPNMFRTSFLGAIRTAPRTSFAQSARARGTCSKSATAQTENVSTQETSPDCWTSGSFGVLGRNFGQKGPGRHWRWTRGFVAWSPPQAENRQQTKLGPKKRNWRGMPTFWERILGVNFFWGWGAWHSAETRPKNSRENMLEEFAEKFVDNSPKIRQTKREIYPKSSLQNLGIKVRLQLFYQGFAKRVVSKRVVSAAAPLYRNFLPNVFPYSAALAEESHDFDTPAPKARTRAHSPKPPFSMWSVPWAETFSWTARI